jgi:transcriptional regulator with XRE-family HTH domain
MKRPDNQAQIRKRLLLALDKLRERGITQQEIATCVGIASQYLSDVKTGRKPVTKLFALRLGACYEFDRDWLMRGGDTPPQFQEPDGPADLYVSVGVGVFHNAICGDPESHPDRMDSIDLSGPAAEQAASAKDPYVLRFAGNDPNGALMPGDLLLISQQAKRTAAVHVIQSPHGLVLARKTKSGTWGSLADSRTLGRNVKAIGHCVGIVWRAL